MFYLRLIPVELKLLLASRLEGSQSRQRSRLAPSNPHQQIAYDPV